MDQDTLLQFAGRLHPLLLHLPIGLWLGIAVLEFGGAMVRRAPGRATLSILTWVAAFGGAFAAGSGWLLAQEGYEAKTVDLHRWLGVAAASIGLLAACFSAMQSRGAFRLLLSIEFVVLMAAGHLGSELTHGKEWLFEPFEKGQGEKVAATGPVVLVPEDPARAPVVPTRDDGDATKPSTTGDDAHTPALPTAEPTPSATSAPTFAASVQPILQRYCTQCHGTQKQKGGLALHERAAIEAGGENGPVVVARQPEVSPLFTNLLLPLDHDDHMPPDGKKQPTPAEVEVLRAWIAAGAPFGEAAAPVAPPKTTPQEPLPEPKVEAPKVEVQKIEAPKVEAPKEQAPKPEAPEEEPKADPAPTEPPAGGGERTAAATGREPAPSVEPAVAPTSSHALQALQKRQVHAAEIAAGLDGLCIDFGPIAASTTADEVRTLLQPVAARVEDLGLARVPVDETLLNAVAALPRLRRLDLRSTRTTTEGLRPLARAARLEELVLASTRLDDRAVDEILRMPALKTLYAWDSGLTAAAVARLRARDGLKVDFGDEPARTAMPQDAPSATPSAPPSEAKPAPNALAPRNALCPVSQKPVDARYVVVHEQSLVGFCCPNCPKIFWQEPAKYPIADR